ncbi:hypothetical protein GA0115240_10584 [Streptomyces sp. DvalAA-14]|uniref:hypothetical protein n=1 Tax=unclassified Streptomyces TaxID=2593676 RepID=UPI00081B19E1|nr:MULTISPECIES: hypothetical protein [unclassified Streptomyces]MYS19153.1 hypothetical protein [Streptomyces sp. SID4948]SCD37993.1 hypothetical protein GA0115240_10584 [Streptomyces sp. DvalAA-14]
MSDDVDELAPHGRDEFGKPLAPYGYRQDGVPKKSNRGRAPAPPKKSEAAAAASPVSSEGDKGKRAAQKQALRELSDMLLTPAALATSSPMFARKWGERRQMAAQGSVIIVGAHVDPIADVLTGLAVDKPGLLGWLEKTGDALPYLAAFKVAGQLAKSLVSNWQNPSPQLAGAARKMGPLRAVQFAREIERQAAEAGLTEDMIEQMMSGGSVDDDQEQEPYRQGDVEDEPHGAVRVEPTAENGWAEYAYASDVA